MASPRSDRFCTKWLGLIALLSGCNKVPEIPVIVPASQIAVVAGFRHLETGEPISGPITVVPGKEFYAIIELEPVPDSDGLLEGKALMPPQCWPCVAISYPAGESIASERAVKFNVLPLRPPDLTCNSPPMLAPNGPQFASPQFQGYPQLATKAPPEVSYQSGIVAPGAKSLVVEDTFASGVIPMWTFIGKTHETPGEYTLEFFVHPFANMTVQPMVVDAVSIHKTTLIIDNGTGN